MAKTRKKNYMLLFLLILLLSITVGYAAFTQNLYISGTATANGNFELVFQNDSIDPNVGAEGSTTRISADGRTLSFNMKLKYPGAGGTINAQIVNTGNITAKLTGITFDGDDDTEITITPHGFVSGQEIAPGEAIDVTISVVWNEDSTTAKTVNFTGTLVYEQSTTNFDTNTING